MMPTREEIEQSKQEGMDARMAPKLEKAYNQSLTSTEMAPAPKPKKDPRNAVRGQKGYAKGGFVRAADGIAQRGKTRGKMC
jgi:hypothetical protein